MDSSANAEETKELTKRIDVMNRECNRLLARREVSEWAERKAKLTNDYTYRKNPTQEFQFRLQLILDRARRAAAEAAQASLYRRFAEIRGEFVAPVHEDNFYHNLWHSNGDTLEEWERKTREACDSAEREFREVHIALREARVEESEMRLKFERDLEENDRLEGKRLHDEYVVKTETLDGLRRDLREREAKRVRKRAHPIGSVASDERVRAGVLSSPVGLKKRAFQPTSASRPCGLSPSVP